MDSDEPQNRAEDSYHFYAYEGDPELYVDMDFVDRTHFAEVVNEPEVSQHADRNVFSESFNANPTNTEGFVTKDFSEDFETDQVWPERQSMIDWARMVGRKRNMVLTIANSLSSKNGRLGWVLLACENYGKYRHGKKLTDQETNEKKVTRTKKSECPFALFGHEVEQKAWQLLVRCGYHNHELPPILVGHSFVGKLSKNEMLLVQDLSEAGTKPKPILRSIKRINPDNVTSRKQLYNARWRLSKDAMDGRTVMQQLMHLITKHGYSERHRMESSGQVLSDMVFSHPDSISMFRLFPYVIIMDTTYKTNRYNMPFLEIVGFTCTLKTFAIAFAWMGRESEEHYTWVLTKLQQICGVPPVAIVTDRELGLINALAKVYPNSKHILCRVHAKRNIEDRALRKSRSKYVQHKFASACVSLFESCTPLDYENKLEEMRLQWENRWDLMNYLESTWLIPYKECLVKAWTDKFTHFGTRTTNRVESAHAMLKLQLASSVNGFDKLFSEIHNLINDQLEQVRASLELSRCTVPIMLRNIAVFGLLPYKVSNECLMELIKIYKMVESGNYDPAVCDDYWWRECHGLPCPHELAAHLHNRTPLQLSEIHVFWKQVKWYGNIKHVQDAEGEQNESLDDLGLENMFAEFSSGRMSKEEKKRLNEAWNDLRNPPLFIMKEPHIHVTKGRPNKNSTSRDLSALEYTEKEYQRSKSKRSKRGAPRRGKGHTGHGSCGNPNSNRPQSNAQRLQFDFGTDVDFFIVNHISNVVDVISDGHCGFRSFAEVLGWGQQEWGRVRRELVYEIDHHRELYNTICLPYTIDDVRNQINYYGTHAPIQHWLTMPHTGLIFATLYNVVLVHLHNHVPVTCLPMSSRGNSNPPNRILCIALLETRQHFVPVWLSDEAPLPPVVLTWLRHHDPSVDGWDIHLQSRIQEFRRLREEIGRGV